MNKNYWGNNNETRDNYVQRIKTALATIEKKEEWDCYSSELLSESTNNLERVASGLRLANWD